MGFTGVLSCRDGQAEQSVCDSRPRMCKNMRRAEYIGRNSKRLLEGASRMQTAAESSLT